LQIEIGGEGGDGALDRLKMTTLANEGSYRRPPAGRM
jgi:hypothetical protein